MNFTHTLILLGFLLLIGCNEGLEIDLEKIDPVESDTADPCAEGDSYANPLEEHNAAINDFAFDIFQATQEEIQTNLLQSPLSIYSALLLAFEGSACETRQQIQNSLKLVRGEETNLNPSISYNAFINQFEVATDSMSLELHNAVFVDNNKLELGDYYQNILDKGYGATIQNLDFTNTESLDQINGWAAEKTDQKINQILEEISPEEIAFLLNAILMKGDWTEGFFEDGTREGDFTLEDGTVVTVPMMNHDGMRTVFTDESMQLLDLQLKGEKYAVSFVAPTDPTQSLSDFVSATNFKEQFYTALEQSERERVFLKLPKFEIENKQNLQDILKTLGMKHAFDRNLADFSLMGNSSNQIFLTRVIHNSYLKVDEKGIEGAAVTAVGVGITSVPPSLDFNRPFILIVRHIETGIPMFIGKIMNPAE